MMNGASQLLLLQMALVANAGNPAVCIMSHCPLKFGKCGFNGACRPALGCVMGCASKKLEDQSSCAFQCEMMHGKNNPVFDDFLNCMLHNGCMAKYPDDGKCYVDPAKDGEKNVTSMAHVAGHWWGIRGLNKHFDFLPCSINRWEQKPDGSWRDNVTWTNAFVNPPVTTGSYPIVSIDPSRPGDIFTNYTDAPLQPQLDHWVVVSKPHPDYMFLIWCGGNPVVTMGGALVVSKNKNEYGMPEWVAQRFREVAQRQGFDYDTMTSVDASDCHDDPAHPMFNAAVFV